MPFKSLKQENNVTYNVKIMWHITKHRTSSVQDTPHQDGGLPMMTVSCLFFLSCRFIQKWSRHHCKLHHCFFNRVIKNEVFLIPPKELLIKIFLTRPFWRQLEHFYHTYLWIMPWSSHISSANYDHYGLLDSDPSWRSD